MLRYLREVTVISVFKMQAARFARELKRNKRFYFFGALAVLAAIAFATVMHARTLPFAEGWYTYYAECINKGLLPYRDFEYLYPPFYIYFIAFFTRVFGYELIALRRLGILIFALLAWGLYLAVVAVVGKRRSEVAFLATLAGVFYMQSEVVQVFYDYVRVMDLFNVLLVCCLLSAVRGLRVGGNVQKALIRCGFLLGFLLHIKQNTGLIMLVFSLVLLLYVGLLLRRAWGRIARDVFGLLWPVAAVWAAVMIALACTGSLVPYFAMTWGRAAGAKGGFFALFFGWILHNGNAFASSLPLALFLLSLLVGTALFLHRYEGNGAHKAEVCALSPYRRVGAVAAFVAVALFFAFLFFFCHSRQLTAALLPAHYLSVYAVFLTVTPLFVLLGVWGIVDTVRHTCRAKRALPYLTLSGAYVALSFACGNSGGLADGQAYFGVAFLVCAFFLLCERCYLLLRARRAGTCHAVRAALTALCLLLALQSAGKKMVYTYNWWGMTEADYWSSTEKSELPLLRGIRLSPETGAVYEEIFRAVTAHTAPGDPIYCFPQIPLFYSLCGRPDPDVFVKVQWFDVASDAAVVADIARLRELPPRAVLIYHTSDYAYEAHEASFRGGAVSGTRVMRDFLLDFVQEQGYTLYGSFEAHGNILSLWIVPM